MVPETKENVKYVLVELWASVQTFIQRGTIRFGRGIVYDTHLRSRFVGTYHSMVRQVVKSIGGRSLFSYRLNDALLQLILNDVVVLLQNMWVLFQTS